MGSTWKTFCQYWLTWETCMTEQVSTAAWSLVPQSYSQWRDCNACQTEPGTQLWEQSRGDSLPSAWCLSAMDVPMAWKGSAGSSHFRLAWKGQKKPAFSTALWVSKGACWSQDWASLLAAFLLQAWSRCLPAAFPSGACTQGPNSPR